MEDFKNILYPIGLTDISPKLASYVATMANKFDAQVHLLHVLIPAALRHFQCFGPVRTSFPNFGKNILETA